MRLAMEHLKSGFTIHHGNLRIRLTSVRSLLHYLSYRIYDKGITITPSFVRREEVLRYLLDSFDSEMLEPLKSYSDGSYQIDNYLKLDFTSKVSTDTELKRVLDLLSAYYRTRKTEENISLYLNKRKSLKGNVDVKPYAKFEYGRVKFKGVNDLSYHENYYTVGNAKESYVSHIFYDALADYGGFKRDAEWTFREELTREQESKYITLILDGSIKPNTDLGRKAYKAYMRIVSLKSPNVIYEETFMRRMEEIDAITVEILGKGLQLKGVTDYSVIYEDNKDEVKYVPIYGGYYAWDNDYNRPLDDVNRLRGIGGEFTREVDPDKLPYDVMVDGKRVEMYRVEIEREDVESSKLFSKLQEHYEESIGNDGLSFNMGGHQDYQIRADVLEPSGFPYIGEDDYIRVLNATDLEMNGDVVKYMSNMHLNLNQRSQLKSTKQYQDLQEDDKNVDLKVKNIVVEETNEMFIKQHLKYYDESDGEQVVEGMVLVNKDLEVVPLYTSVSEGQLLPLDESDLDKKRIGVYGKEEDALYVYKFMFMMNTDTRKEDRITHTVTGINRTKSNKLKTVALNMLGLSSDEEERFLDEIKSNVINIATKSESPQEFYGNILNSKVGV